MRRSVFLFLFVLFICGCADRAGNEDIEITEDFLSLIAQADLLQLSQPDSAYLLAKRAIPLAETENNTTAFAQGSVLVGRIYFQRADYENAIATLIRADAVISEERKQPIHGDVKNLLGQVYQSSKQPELALQHFRESLRIFQDLPDKHGLAETYGHLGHFYEKNMLYDSALRYQLRALDMYEALNDTIGQAAIYDNIGSVYEDLGNYELAKPNFQKAYQLNLSSGQINQALGNLNNLGDLLRKTKKPKEAQVIYTEVLESAQANNLTSAIRSAYRDLGKVYYDLGNTKMAYIYLDSCYELNKQIFSDEIAREIASTKSVFDSKQKDQRITLLEKDKKLARINRIALIVASSLLFVIGSLVYFHFRTRLRKNRRIFEAELGYKKLQETKLYEELANRSKELTANALHIIQKNEFLDKLKRELKDFETNDDHTRKRLKKIIRSIDYNFSLDDDWHEFETVFQQVHSKFFEQLRTLYPSLSSAEIRLCAMLRLNLASKDIATIMGISQDSLRIARYRLRKKLGIDKGSNLYSFIMNID